MLDWRLSFKRIWRCPKCLITTCIVAVIFVIAWIAGNLKTEKMNIDSVPCQYPNNKLFGRKRTKPEFAYIRCFYVFCKKNPLVNDISICLGHYSGKLMFLSLLIFTFSTTYRYCSRLIEYWNRETSPLELIWRQGYTIRCL